MSDFQKIGDSLMVIRVWSVPEDGGVYSARDVWLVKIPIRGGEPGWVETTQQDWKARKADLDKVPS